MKPRVLIAHNTYQYAGGEDLVVANELALLKRAGHDVRLYSVNNDAIVGLGAKIRAALEVAYSKRARQRFREVLSDFKPDIVHVHNFFPQLTPSIYDACRDAGAAVVQTLHNYRTICPTATLMLDGKVCERSLHQPAWWAVPHKTYKGSLLGTLALANMIEFHKRKGTWATKVDRFIALSQFARSKFVAAGFPDRKIVVKPNFVEHRPMTADGERNGALYVGRLSEEKGLRTLLRAFQELDYPLRIVGDGPLRRELASMATSRVRFLGQRPAEDVRREMANAAVFILPSECYENCPMTVLEAFASGLPVIASKIGSLQEMIKDQATGLHFEAGDDEDLAAKIRWAVDHPTDMTRMSEAAHLLYRSTYSAEANYQQLMAVYREARGEVVTA